MCTQRYREPVHVQSGAYELPKGELICSWYSVGENNNVWMDYEYSFSHFAKILLTTAELGKHNCEDTMTKIATQSIQPKILDTVLL